MCGRGDEWASSVNLVLAQKLSPCVGEVPITKSSPRTTKKFGRGCVRCSERIHLTAIQCVRSERPSYALRGRSDCPLRSAAPILRAHWSAAAVIALGAPTLRRGRVNLW